MENDDWWFLHSSCPWNTVPVGKRYVLCNSLPSKIFTRSDIQQYINCICNCYWSTRSSSPLNLITNHSVNLPPQTLSNKQTSLGSFMTIGGIIESRLGARYCCLIGGYILVLGIFLSSMVTSLPQLIMTNGVLFGMGVGICYR